MGNMQSQTADLLHPRFALHISQPFLHRLNYGHQCLWCLYQFLVYVFEPEVVAFNIRVSGPMYCCVSDLLAHFSIYLFSHWHV